MDSNSDELPPSGVVKGGGAPNVVPVTITTASTIKPSDNFEFFIIMFVRLLVPHPMRTAFSKMIAQHVHGKATRPFFESQKAASNRHTRVQ